jgi:hypothetical protein
MLPNVRGHERPADRGFLNTETCVNPHLLLYGKRHASARMAPSCWGTLVMAIQLADVELDGPRAVQEVPARPLAAFDSTTVDDNEGVMGGRGIVAAVLISAPFWALLAFTLYLVL